jgi:hypothetical protein
MKTYSYTKCLENAQKVNWRIADVLGGDPFDTSKAWLPAALSASSRLTSFGADERRMLTHVEMAAYAHLFAYVEEFVAPKVSSLASEVALDDQAAFDALANFAAEEVKHTRMFRKLRDEIDGVLGFELETARFVMTKSTASVVLLTACIEWLTQRHHLEAFDTEANLDPRTKRIFKAHWQEEAQHAQLDHLETLRAFEGLSDEEGDHAVDELIELVAAVDGLLQQQVEHDIANFERYTGRACSPGRRKELRAALSASKRWTFIESGTTHPRFEELLVAVTTSAQRERIGEALGQLFGAVPAAA